MSWHIDFDDKAKKNFDKLDHSIRQRILSYLNRIRNHPLSYAEMLAGGFAGLYKFRVGDYRLIAKIEENKMTVLVVKIGHRRDVYER